MSEQLPTLPAEFAREERRVVTAVFADLVGSTALAEQLDPEEARLIVGESIARIVVEVERFGGYVKDLAGDGVLALFGAPVAHEDDAERAVRAGLRILDEIGAYGADVARAWGIEALAVRIGISSGPVVLGEIGAASHVEYGAHGDAVNTAARLQGAALPGTVLVDASAQRACASLFEWGEERRLELKGKSQPVLAYQARAARPRPPDAVHARLVGRERELEQTRGVIAALASGVGGIVFITGEPGIGKSRLLAELRAEHSGRWLEARCVSYGDSLHYWPFRDLVRDWLHIGLDDPELRMRVALRRGIQALFGGRTLELYPYLGSLLGLALEPDAAARVAQLSPEALQFRTFEVVGELLRRLAIEGSLAIAVEDLHWADSSSIQLLEQLFALTEDVPLLFLLSQRNEPDHPSWKLKELAEREFPHATREICLEPLSGDAQRELLHVLVAPSVLPAELEERLLDQAEGNPFYLEELVGALAQSGALVRERDGWRFDHDLSIEVPEGVEKVILARLDRLPPRSREVLKSASAIGRRFSLALLEGMVEPDGPVHEALHELQRADLVRVSRRWPEPEYRFKHVLIQETAYRTLLAPSRRTLHRRAAEWLEERYAASSDEALDLLAHHWQAAEDEEKAIAYLMRAGDKARQEFALDEAVGHYHALLPLLERRGERSESALVLFKLALALHTAMRFREANETYRRAFEMWTPPNPTPIASAILRVARPRVPLDPDPSSSFYWIDIQFCMQLFDRLVEAWPERAIVPALAERWEISDDGLRYVFHLRDELHWSDGEPLTAQDIEFGVKRTLDPDRRGGVASIYFVLENAQDYYLGHERDAGRVGVKALDERTVEFRLAAPAPYFMSVVNRPDAGPQPRHAIERHGEEWALPEHQVVSGPFRALRDGDRLALERRPDYRGWRTGNVARVEFIAAAPAEAAAAYEANEVDVVVPTILGLDLEPADAVLGPASATMFLMFDHVVRPTSSLDFRRALAHAIDREALAALLSEQALVARGGLVPPALQGHTPDIALPFDADLARAALAQSGETPELHVAAQESDLAVADLLARVWRDVLRIEVRTETTGPSVTKMEEVAPVVVTWWLPGYADPEYYLRLVLHSRSQTNHGSYSHVPFDELVERAQLERDGRQRLELFHKADRMAVVEQVAVVPLVYARNAAYVKPWVTGWWEFGKSSASVADLVVGDRSPRFSGERPHPAG